MPTAFIGGEFVPVKIESIDTTTFSIPMYSCTITAGKWEGERVVVHALID